MTLTIRRGPNRRTREVRPITPVDAVASVHGETSIEGTFLLCTFLLVRVMADRGRITQARAVFKNAQSHVNDVGRLAEEIDSATGEQLGNFPQAFSHVILVNAAWSI